jgi:hypothetical protein
VVAGMRIRREDSYGEIQRLITSKFYYLELIRMGAMV